MSVVQLNEYLSYPYWYTFLKHLIEAIYCTTFDNFVKPMRLPIAPGDKQTESYKELAIQYKNIVLRIDEHTICGIYFK